MVQRDTRGEGVVYDKRAHGHVVCRFKSVMTFNTKHGLFKWWAALSPAIHHDNLAQYSRLQLDSSSFPESRTQFGPSSNFKFQHEKNLTPLDNPPT